MPEEFNILDYLSGLTTFVLDKAVLQRIALDRGVSDVEDYDELDVKTRDLLRADVMYAAYLSPNVWASHTNAHGSFSRTIGSQSVYEADRDRLFQSFVAIYRKYNDDILAEIESSSSNLQWL